MLYFYNIFIFMLHVIYYIIMQHMIKRRNLNSTKKKKKDKNIKINIFNIKLIYSIFDNNLL